MKIDRRIAYKIVLDTETCPMDKDFEGVSPYNMLTYNMGWAVTDKRGITYRTRSYINKDVFFKEKELMNSAYYANKIPQYMEQIEKGEIIVASWYEIMKALKEDIAEFEVEQIYAHNMRFDYGTTVTTQRWLTKSKYRYVFPKGIEICDTLKMANDVIGKMPTYRKFCEENGFLTKTGRLSMTAENLYRFITNDPTFIESHTALEDVLIEKEILAYCYKQHKKMCRKLWEQGLTSPPQSGIIKKNNKGKQPLKKIKKS